MQVFDKAKTWWRARKEKAAEAKACKQHYAADQLHGHGRFWLLNVPVAATLCAATVEWYWALLFCIEATGHIDWNWETGFGSAESAQNAWNFAFSAHIPVLIGLLAATAPIVMLSMVWLPVQFAMRGAGQWRRGSIIAVGLLANVLVIVSGTVVMNYNRQEQVRDALVVEQTAQAGRGAIEAQIAAVTDDLARLTDRRVNNEYAATAANVGAAAYRAQYMSEAALARSPVERRDIIVRALGAAERADALRAERTALFQRLAQAPTQAAVAANVQDNVGAELNTFAQYVEVWRPPFIALICTLIGIFGTWWVIAMLERMNPKDVLRSGWAPEELRIEDKREEEPVTPQPMKPAREVVTDAETGEELVRITPRPHWRKRKGRVNKVVLQPQAPPDEAGVAYDGGGRVGSGEQSHEAPEQESAESAAEEEEQSEGDAPQSDPAEQLAMSEDELSAVFGADLPADAPVDESDANADADKSQEPDTESDHSEPPAREPETRPERLIAAE